MFQFNFDVNGDEEAMWEERGLTQGPDTFPSTTQTGEPFSEVSLDSLFNTLPPQISYSFLSTPSSDGDDLKIARRDLYDARFQLISEGTVDPESVDQTTDSSTIGSALQFIDNPSDLVPLVYEGGLKTWECSLDLASCLKHGGYVSKIRGARVLELGCGTAIPTLYILHELFSSKPAGKTDHETHIHLQDYNTSVLQLVTMPNVLLAWYTSPAANTYRTSLDPQDADESEPELHITPSLLDAFQQSLQDHKLTLRFFSGSWNTFDLARTNGRYDLVLSSETIYHPQSLSSLVRVMRGACASPSSTGIMMEDRESLCLVAAKTVYFGVGGGIAEFIRCVEGTTDERGRGGQVEVVWEKSTGVSRKVMSVKWA